MRLIHNDERWFQVRVNESDDPNNVKRICSECGKWHWVHHKTPKDRKCWSCNIKEKKAAIAIRENEKFVWKENTWKEALSTGTCPICREPIFISEVPVKSVTHKHNMGFSNLCSFPEFVERDLN